MDEDDEIIDIGDIEVKEETEKIVEMYEKNHCCDLITDLYLLETNQSTMTMQILNQL